MSKIALALALLLGFAPAAVATDYWVAPSPAGNDANAGTQLAPFATIAKAHSVATVGTTVRVKDGTYTPIVVTTKSGTAAARITFVAVNRGKAKIVTNGASTHWSWTSNGAYNTIQGFDVTGNGAGGILSLGNETRIVRNTVHDIPAACTSNGGAGIDAGNQTGLNTDIDGNIVKNIGIFSQHCQTVHGIYHSHPGGKITNNIVDGNTGAGIHLFHNPTNLTIANNVSVNNGVWGIIVGAPADNMIVTNNIVQGNGTYGIKESSGVGPNNTYVNNIVRNNPVDWSLLNGNTHQGTIVTDPLFVSATDFHLRNCSPGIDSGTSLGAPPVDNVNIARPQGAGIDRGAYERTATCP